MRKKPTAGIILAAGMSIRFGSLKQLIKIGEKTILSMAVEAAERSELDQIILVLGHQSDAIIKELGEDFNNPKPDPEGLIEIIERFTNESITKENTIYVGDSYIDGIAAYRANIRFIWFNSRDTNTDLMPIPPYAILTDWSNFESVLQEKT